MKFEFQTTNMALWDVKGTARIIATTALVVLAGTATDAKIWQNRLYSDDMILESREAYDIRPFISGFGDTPGENVVVKFVGGSYPTTVGADGLWEVQMNACDELVDQQLMVTGENNSFTYVNVACGQVFVCSGQSNMELPLSYVINATEEIAAANRPNWRLFRVPHVASDTPQNDMQAEDPNTKLPATWLVSNSSLAARFSATCYLSARHISELYWGDAPIGLIWASWGGTRVEAWAPADVKSECSKIEPGPPVIPGPQAYSVLYNGMIHPLTRYSIRAVFWFQGEHNVVTHSSRELYACEFGAMINSWRDAWRGIGDFPFLWAQLSAYTGYSNFPGHGDTSVIRLAQADCLPKIGLDTTGMAVTFDLGDPKAPAGDVHSRLKEEVARRLALQALHTAYAFQENESVVNHGHPQLTPHPINLQFSGPTFKAVTSATDSQLVLEFVYGDDMYFNGTSGCEIHRGTDFHNNPIGGECCKAKDTFQVCNGDLDNSTYMNCANATITIKDNTIMLDYKLVGAAKFVRHAYANYPQCALYNKYNLPASPFIQAVTVAEVKNNNKQQISRVKLGDVPAKTPPMGLNSWNAFHCNVDERKMRAMADALVSTGLSKVGYDFVNIDDCWQVQRMTNGSINSDPVRFPGGMKPLADYIHSLGLKFGVYTAQRTFTCQSRPGSYEHEEIDVESYCEWGVDYLKVDACSGPGYAQGNTSWIKFRAAIDECSKKRGYPITLSVESCDNPDACGQWIGGLANLWRTCGDIQATFASVMSNVAENTKMAAIAGPSGGPLGGGHWNDADMLQVGDIGLSITEQRAHFCLWVMMASPLLIGSDVSMLTKTSLEILGNAEATKINQDAKGIQGIPVPAGIDAHTAPCWMKPLDNGDIAVLLLNTGDNTTKITCDLSVVGVKAGAKAVRDLWAKKDLGPIAAGGSISANLETHDVFFVRVTPAAAAGL